MTALFGYADPAPGAAAGTHHRVAERLGRKDSVIEALFGLWTSRFVQGRMTDSYDGALRSLELAPPGLRAGGQRAFRRRRFRARAGTSHRSDRALRAGCQAEQRRREAVDHRHPPRRPRPGVLRPCPLARWAAARGAWRRRTMPWMLARSRRAPVQPCGRAGLRGITYQMLDDDAGPADERRRTLRPVRALRLRLLPGMGADPRAAGRARARPDSSRCGAVSTTSRRKARSRGCRTG